METRTEMLERVRRMAQYGCSTNELDRAALEYVSDVMEALHGLLAAIDAWKARAGE